MTAMITTRPGINSHGINTIERIFCAEYNRTPQLTIGVTTPIQLTIDPPMSVRDIYLEIGQFVGPEARAAQLADLSEFIIKTSDLTELEVVKISVGQIVEVVPDALPDTLLTGKVDRIGQSFNTQAGDIIYTITISLDESDPNLRWGMTVELTFLPE